MAGTDCGFAQSPFAQRVHPTIMWAKLKAMVDGAKIASKALWKKKRRAACSPRRPFPAAKLRQSLLQSRQAR
jgi:5-methyltetrahydropteroyltriglutamate--homocysteine methyltransferase